VLPGHGLDTNELSHLYHSLDDEVKRARIGRAARVAFRLLEGSSYLLPLVLGLAYLFDAVGPRLGPGMQTLVDYARAWLGGLVLPLIAAIVALFLANLPLITRTFRQWRLSRRLKTLRMLDYAMLPPPRFRVKWLVLVVPLGFLMLFLYGLLAPAEPAERRAVALTLLVLLPAALLLVDRQLRRLRGQLEYFEEVRFLRSELARAASTEGEPTLPPRLLARIGDLERSRLFRSSAEAIAHRPAEEARRFAVSKSDSVTAMLRKLDASERVRIENAIDELASTAGPPFVLHVEGTGWELVYEVEAATRTIQILTLRSRKDVT
jgi:hypothetical protein